LLTIDETWDTPHSPPAWLKIFVFAPLTYQSLVSVDANGSGWLYYYTGGFLAPTLYDYNRSTGVTDENDLNSAYTNLPTGLLSTTAGVYWARSSDDGGGIDFYSSPPGQNTQTTPSLTFARSGLGALPNGGAMALGSDGLLYVADASGHRIVRYDAATGAYVSEFAIPAGVAVNTLAMNGSGLLFMADFNENDGGYIFDAGTGAQVGTFDLPLDVNAPGSNGGNPALSINGDTLVATSGSGQDIYTFDLSAVPEPAASFLWSVGGMLTLAFGRWRSRSLVGARTAGIDDEALCGDRVRCRE
jgi:hypothetical protein